VQCGRLKRPGFSELFSEIRLSCARSNTGRCVMITRHHRPMTDAEHFDGAGRCALKRDLELRGVATEGQDKFNKNS
jgi:hypothetical protein